MLSKGEFDEVNAKAAAGDADAQLRMAIHHLTDTIEGPDPGKAEKWLERAASKGNALAGELRSAWPERPQHNSQPTNQRSGQLANCMLVSGIALLFVLVWVVESHGWLEKAQAGFVRTPELASKNMGLPIGGTWDGYFIEGGNQTKFTLVITESGSTLAGTMRERGERSTAQTSDVSGTRNGTQISLVKRYRSNGSSVVYRGNVNSDATAIDGAWIAGNLYGPWHVSRVQIPRGPKHKRSPESTQH